MVPSRQNYLFVLVALAVEEPKKSVKVAQHEPIAHDPAVPSQGIKVEAVLFLNEARLARLLHCQLLTTPPMVKLRLWKLYGAQTFAAVDTATPPLVSLAQQYQPGQESAVPLVVQAVVNEVGVVTINEVLLAVARVVSRSLESRN